MHTDNIVWVLQWARLEAFKTRSSLGCPVIILCRTTLVCIRLELFDFAVSNLWHVYSLHSTFLGSTQLREYLAIENEGYLCTTSCVVITAWLNSSQLNRSITKWLICKLRSHEDCTLCCVRTYISTHTSYENKKKLIIYNVNWVRSSGHVVQCWAVDWFNSTCNHF